MTTSRELVYQTLNFNNPERVPRDLWKLPWADINYGAEVKEIMERFPNDLHSISGYQDKLPPTSGTPNEIGEYIDEWGCKFYSKQRGIIGEVKEPLIVEENWEDRNKLRLPMELLDINLTKINQFCQQSEKFTLAGFWPRPFERLQFIRGTEQLFIDLLLKPAGLLDVIYKMHEFYCELLSRWAQTGVDALGIMDDWGSQNSLLISPALWREVFRPMYQDYIKIAHDHGKKIFMHSDGHILAILPDLIEMGLDAINSQLFCMGLDNLEKYKGQITFWGEIDRQWLLPHASQEEITTAVQEVKARLWQEGGCIAQCEFGPGARPENVKQVFRSWEKI